MLSSTSTAGPRKAGTRYVGRTSSSVRLSPSVLLLPFRADLRMGGPTRGVALATMYYISGVLFLRCRAGLRIVGPTQETALEAKGELSRGPA